MTRTLPTASALLENTLKVKNKDTRIKQLVWLMNTADNDVDADFYYNAIMAETKGKCYGIEHC
jgi:hypothetical protein